MRGPHFMGENLAFVNVSPHFSHFKPVHDLPSKDFITTLGTPTIQLPNSPMNGGGRRAKDFTIHNHTPSQHGRIVQIIPRQNQRGMI